MAITKTSTTTLITDTTTPSTTTPTTTSTATAPKEATKVETQQITPDKEISVEVSGRLNPITKEGIGEDSRSVVYDQQRLTSAQQVSQTIATTQRIQEAAQETAVTISATDAPMNKVTTILAQENAISSSKVTADIQRATQRNQRTCNHKYSLITNKCNFCGKDRNSHVYDV